MSQVKKMLLGTAFVGIRVRANRATFRRRRRPDVRARRTDRANRAAATEYRRTGADRPVCCEAQCQCAASTEYKASKKASKQDLKATNKEAKAQYKEQVRNAKINKKADNQTANDDTTATEPDGPKDTGLQH